MPASGATAQHDVVDDMETENEQTNTRTSCVRCGDCCRKGGPVLHREDIEVLRAGHASHRHLTTIRKGELAFHPVIDKVVQAREEMVRVSGQPKSWTCVFFEEQGELAACTIYEHRFRECRALECWNPEEALDVIGDDTITRADLLNPDDPLLEIMSVHDRECPHSEVERLIAAARNDEARPAALATLTDLVHRDLTIRLYATTELGLAPEMEMFTFGRPIFKSLGARGIDVHEDQGRLRLEWNPKEPDPEV